ncbi:MAG: hypothetical protein NT155_02970 [Candidatus Staskawiczbacteria bacterium]|nr:hypothetical protein [Candidatus Staskawiczbacteria bacterium]
MNTFKVILIGIMTCICLSALFMPQTTDADFPGAVNAPYMDIPKVVKTVKVVITAYSSTLDQTDDSPFVTASGKCVEDGIIANNMLPFGTEVRIPDLYGDKVFVVEDRMNKKKGNYHVDIWMPDRESAVNFGAKIVDIEVLES